jgi:hypothetical protein
MIDAEVSQKWNDIGGEKIASINTTVSCTMGGNTFTANLSEIWLNFDTKQIKKLSRKQVWIIWKYFEYIRKIYPNATMEIMEVNKNTDDDYDDETEHDCILIVPTPTNK